MQYNIQQAPDGSGMWGEISLPDVWYDFAGQEAGVIFTIWDASRLHWFAQPKYLEDGKLKKFLMSRRFQRWGYFPVDAASPGNRLTVQGRETLKGYDRTLAYTKWAMDVAKTQDWIPHGINLDVFQPRGREMGRMVLEANLTEDDFVIGCVMTNQVRKDWGLVAAVLGELKRRIPRLRAWWHTDLDIRHWNLHALIEDYGLKNMVHVTHTMNDTQLSYAYSACDLTLAPSPEGFGYPIFESLACGTPVLHGDCAGGADILKQCKLDDLLVKPVAWRLETQFNCLRPVYEPSDWVNAVMTFTMGMELEEQRYRDSLAHLSWKNLWRGAWLPWFERGLA
jgi:glycosyltransferase involved in cell wall biosynthesis